MRLVGPVFAAAFGIGTAWLAFADTSAETTFLVGGKNLKIRELKSRGRVEVRHGGFYLVTLPGSAGDVKGRLQSAGAEFILPPDSDSLDRRSAFSKERHNRYLRAVARLNGLDEANATATFKESIDMEVDKRADHNGYLDFDAIRRAADHRDQMPKVHIGYQEPGSNAPQAPWTHLGPFNAKPPFQYCNGPGYLSGRKEGIAVARTDGNTIWTVSRGGAYKTTDGGATWRNMSMGWKFSNANCVAIDPSDKNIVYIGTGDYADGGGYGSLPFGIMKTSDGGLTWSNYGDLTTFDVDEVITDIVIAPWDRTELFCTTRHGNRLNPSAGSLYRSTNSGLTWSNSGQPDRSYTDMTTSIGINLFGTTFYYVFVASDDGTILRSTNGTSWTSTTTKPGSGYTHIAASKLSAAHLYAVTASGLVKKSEDLGDTWVDFNSAGAPTREDGGTNWGQLTYNLFVGVAKVDNDTERIWVGNLSCATRTTDSATWTDVSKSYWDTARGHADHHSFANDPSNDTRVYFGTDGGLYRTYTNSPTTLVNLNGSFGDFQFYSLDVHPTLPDFIMAGAQDNAVSATRGDLNAWTGLDAWDGAGVAFDKVNPKIHYTSAQNGAVYRYSADFQDNLSNVNITPTDPQLAGAAFIPPMATVGTGSEILLGSRYVLRYPGTGTTWTQGYDTGSTVDEFSTIGNVVFFGCRNGNVYRSSDKGATATRIDGTIPATAIGAIHARTTAYVLVGVMGTSGGLYLSTNATAATPTWTDVSGSGTTGLPDSPVNTIAIDPHNASRWYVGTDAGLFMTANSGATWANCTTQGFPNVSVSALKIAHGFLYATTAGRGAFRIKIGPTVGHSISGTVWENGVGMRNIPVTARADQEVENRLTVNPGVTIPDNNLAGISSTYLNLVDSHTMLTCKVFVHITHANRGDLQIDLTPPNGSSIRLKSTNSADNGDDVVATYDVTGWLGGESSLGAWKLTVRDLSSVFTGKLNTWSVIYTYPGSPIIAETVTNNSGGYTLSALVPGTYEISPFKPGKVFGPNVRTISMSSSDITGENFNSVVPISITPAETKIYGGNSVTAALRLTTTPPFTVNVAISDNNAATSVPALVAMTTIGPTDFTINSSAVGASTQSIITATYGGVSRSTTITVYPLPTLSSITAGPSPIYGGTSVSGTVTIGAPAPINTVVNLSGYAPDLVPDTPSVTILAGQTSANYTASSAPVATPRTKFLRAHFGSQLKITPIFLEPAPFIASWTFNPNPVIAGQATQGRVQLTRPVVNAPVRVFLTDNSTRVSTPAYVDIPVGQTTATFAATTTQGSSTTYAGMYAAFANEVGKKYVKLTIAPTLKINSFTFAPNPVQGGQSTTGTVVLANPVINSPVRVFLTDNSPKLSMPAYIDIPVGQTTGTFAATTLSTTTVAAAGCYASFAGNQGTKYVKVTITP